MSVWGDALIRFGNSQVRQRIICVHFHKDIIFPHKIITTKKMDPILFLLCLKLLRSRFELAETELTITIFRYSKDAIDRSLCLALTTLFDNTN